MARYVPIRHDTLQVILDRRDYLAATLDVTDDEDQVRALRVELRRIRELLSTYTGRSNPTRDMFAQDDE